MAKPAAKTKPAPVADAPAFNALRITSAREGFRRAGRPWSATPTEVLLSEFDDAQLAMLRAEAMLTIEGVTL